MKIIKNWIKIYKAAKNIDAAWFKILEGLMNFATDVQQNGKPMLTKIAVVDMSKEKVIGDFDIVHIWAGVGEANPIERIRHLKAQNQTMKDLLKTCKSFVGSNNDLILNITIVLDTFE